MPLKSIKIYQTLIVSFVISFLLSLNVSTGSEWEADGQINWGSGECWDTQYTFIVNANGLVTAGDEQVSVDFCGNHAYSTLAALPNTTDICYVPEGFQVTIKDLWFQAIQAIDDATEHCLVGLSTDVVGTVPYTFESWASFEVGSDNTDQANCDGLDDIGADGFFSSSNDRCHMTDPIGTIITGTGAATGWRLLVDQAVTGTTTCERLDAMIVVIKTKTCLITPW